MSENEFQLGDLLRDNKTKLATADYGMTESGVWIPKRVDDEGRTLTKVTGSRVEEMAVVQRDIFTSHSFSHNFEPPTGATGLVLALNVYGMSGSFTAEEGVNTQIFYRKEISAVSNISYLLGQKTRSPIFSIYHLHSNAQEGVTEGIDIKPSYNRYYQISHLILPGHTYRVDLLVSGTFETGEGVDCEIVAYWIF